MRLLNAHSSAGAVVRAAKLRHARGKERGTIQCHAESALKRWDMHIKCGVQQNDASETFAVLQSLLKTHMADDIELYCDNRGYVNIWDRMLRSTMQARGLALRTRGTTQLCGTESTG